MDQQIQRGRSPSAGHQQPHINQSHSPSPSPYPPGNESSVLGLGLALDQSAQQPFGANTSFDSFNSNNGLSQSSQDQSFGQATLADNGGFDPNTTGASFAQAQPAYLSPNINDGADFSLFPPASGQGDQFNAPLFDPSLNPNDLASMTSPQTHHSPTPPHLLQPDSHQPGSAQHSPSFNQFSSPSGDPRHASLGPEAALLPNQMTDWTQPQFQTHRRTPSEYSDISSAPSPNLVSADAFEDIGGHSPHHRPSDGSLYQEVLSIGNFSISDPQVGSPGHQGRSPSHSPAISPRIIPQQMPDMGHQQQQSFGLAPANNAYGAPSPYADMQGPGAVEAFPTLQTTGPDMSQMAPPAINIEMAPNNGNLNAFEGHKTRLDQDSLTPPDRGRIRNRPRAVTDPFHPGGGLLNRPMGANSLSPSLGSDLSSRSDASRSLSPLDRQATASPSRRRQSTSAVPPNNMLALRLANPEYSNDQEGGPSKRVQKHPATFQCTLCPKRFTRAYNLRSHLRTHTDERPFVCTVCGKAFARQHDRKRHESLHSGEKKFVCKGDLKVGGQWGCGRRFARADALGRHFRSEAGRICIKPLLDEEIMERQRQWQEQRMQQNMSQNMAPAGPMTMDPSGSYPVDASGNYMLPAALLAQYPVLAQMNWSGPDASSGMDDDVSGRSSFDASDYDENDDGGYLSGPGTAYGEGGMNQQAYDMGYTSDFGGR